LELGSRPGGWIQLRWKLGSRPCCAAGQSTKSGDEILAKDIKLPKGAKLVDIDEDTVIVSVQVPEGEEEPAATAADASDGKSDAAK
jgi:hypothetical protein